tara:strand:- start:15 stop:701 length:687 start_codon:yes stop_codon:yes gene_type:complete
MSIKKNIIAIIPARGGSKGIPKKNIINFLGKPLMVHSIDYAKSSNLISDIYLSTDDSDIAKIGLDNGAKIINRPLSISGDEASTESALLHVLENINNNPDVIILLQPTSPLRPRNNLDKVLEHFFSNNYDSLLSISPTHRFFWKINEENAIPKYDFNNRPRRQDIKLEDINYIENGSLYISTYENLITNNNRLGGNIGYVIFDEKYSYEIDSMTDLKFLEALSKEDND